MSQYEAITHIQTLNRLLGENIDDSNTNTLMLRNALFDYLNNNNYR